MRRWVGISISGLSWKGLQSQYQDCLEKVYSLNIKTVLRRFTVSISRLSWKGLQSQYHLQSQYQDSWKRFTVSISRLSWKVLLHGWVVQSQWSWMQQLWDTLVVICIYILRQKAGKQFCQLTIVLCLLLLLATHFRLTVTSITQW